MAFFSGAALVAAGAWLRPLAEAERELREGRLEAALERFAAAQARFERMPVAQQALPAAYAASQANQFAALYRLGRYDELIEKAAGAPPLAAIRFWSGCALFVKAREEQQPEARLNWLSRSVEEFRKALEQEPDDWDAKFNYELSERLLAQLRKQPKTPPSEMLQLLRPKPKEGKPPTRRTG